MLAVLALAGCGGDDDDAARPAQTQAPPRSVTLPSTGPRQTDWAAKADAICSAFQARIDALPQPAQPAEVATLVENTIVLARDEQRRLRTLRPPPRQTAAVRLFLAALDRSIIALERLQRAAEAQDDREAQKAIQLGEAAGRDAARQGDLLGLQICGRT
ncbi:MAG: hypothetical protein H0V40_07310 [Actinobacteria bacterium]|nr:hypothetical protein [Actinomycetota bacterium]